MASKLPAFVSHPLLRSEFQRISFDHPVSGGNEPMSSTSVGTQKLSRRTMLRLSAMTAAGAVIAACAPAAQAPAAGGGASAPAADSAITL